MSTRVNAMRAQLTGRRLVTVMCLLAACRGGDGPPADEAAADAVACDDPAVREVVEEFGRRLNHVSLLAPDSIVEAAMREAYAPFVTAELLDRWIADPASAPGRQVSSPWPQRIEVRSTADAADAQCRVEATVIHVTSADTSTPAVREAVRILVRDVDGWRISGFERVSPGGVSPGEPSADDDGDVAPPSAPPADGSPPAEPSAAGDIEAALAAIEQYYAAIDAGDYRRAYALWSDDGAASGQSFEEFSAGFAGTSSVHVEVGEPGRIGAAAGSRFVTVPVTIHADGPAGAQTFSGTYTLRRSVVDGASAAQRSWRIHSADIR